jgi:hypothetical protein
MALLRHSDNPRWRLVAGGAPLTGTRQLQRHDGHVPHETLKKRLMVRRSYPHVAAQDGREKAREPPAILWQIAYKVGADATGSKWFRDEWK